MLCGDNLWSDAWMQNGALGYIREFVYSNDNDPYDGKLPITVIADLDEVADGISIRLGQPAFRCAVEFLEFRAQRIGNPDQHGPGDSPFVALDQVQIACRDADLLGQIALRDPRSAAAFADAGSKDRVGHAKYPFVTVC